MTDLDALSALLAAATAFSEEASPGPWWRETGVATSEEEHMVWLTNEGRDTLMVNADDAAMLVNALPSLLEAARREAGLDPYDMRIMVRALYVSGLTDDMNPVDRRKAAIRLRSSLQEQARLLHDSAGTATGEETDVR